mgnify:CR=1 FL=1
MLHILHLMMDGIWKSGMVDLPDEEQARREARKVALLFVSQMGSLGEVVRQRILSQKNAPVENSSQWHNLYQKYYEEELRRRGG